MKTRYRKPTKTRDLCEQGRIILAHGEVTGHLHEVLPEIANANIPAVEFFEEPDGRRVLLIIEVCVLRHPEHSPISLDPRRQEQVRQGDVLLNPIGAGVWEVVRQREYSPDAIRTVAD